MVEQAYDVAVVGAGPAGLTAATTAAEHGLRVALVDAGSRPGGQYYRHHDDAGAARHGPRFARHLARLFAHADTGRLAYLPSHTVWTVEQRLATGEGAPRFRLHLLRTSGTAAPPIAAGALVVATGAYDRQVPFPGWELPGVLAAGGAQALVKGGSVVPGTRIVVAGSGPFLLPVATGLAAAGGQVLGVFEASRVHRYLRHTRVLARHPARFAEAAGYAWALRRHKVPYRTGYAVVAAEGTTRLEAVTVARLDDQQRPVRGTERRVRCDALAVGHGFVPQLELLTTLGCALTTDPTGTPVAQVDDDQHTTVDGVYTAGETTGVGGAALAEVEGEVAALAVARASGRSTDAAHLRTLRARRASLRAFAAVLADVHPPPAGWWAAVPDRTLVCRCEEVTAGAVRRAVRDLGATDPRGVKLFTRVGMGRCQGRICAPALGGLVGELTGRPPTDVDLAALHHRPLATPVPLGVLAGLTDPPDRPAPTTGKDHP